MRCRKPAASRSRVAVTEMAFVLHASTVSSRFCLVLADPSLGPCHRGVRRTFSASPPLSPLLAPEAFDAGRPRARSDLFLAARKGWNLPLSLPSHPSSPTVVIVTCFGLGNWANPHRPPSRNPSETLDPPTRLSRPLAQSLVSARLGGP
jgi:hypothetical protein